MALAGLSFQSCQKMLHTESTIATFEEQHKLNSASDSVYSVLGILKNIQAIADQTFLLGELRGDLAALTDTADINLREIADFNVSETNKYNTPTQYYAIINNCNYFLKNADMDLMQNNVQVFEREYAAIQGYRAWTYIQLALAYGKVPFITEPILSGDIAKPELYPNLKIDEIAERLIPELEPLVNSKLPDYGNLSNMASANFFIPIRLILGDLYLWSGNYLKAAKMYHDYLYSIESGNVEPVYDYRTYWYKKDLNFLDDAEGTLSDGYSSNVLCYIPMEASEYDGYVSELPDIFESTIDNNYFYQAKYSKALTRYSAMSKYCYVDVDDSRKRRSIYVLDSKNYETSAAMLKGDLRMYSNFNISYNRTDESSLFNSEILTNYKIDDQEISMYTLDAVYLRLAEALNRAKMPQAAFCILKYGLCEQNVNNYIPFHEKKLAASNNLLDFPNEYFQPYELSAYSDYTYPANANTIGIHSRGSGDATRDPNYVLPMPSEFDIDTLSTRYTDDMSLAEQREYVDSFWVSTFGLDTTSTGRDAIYMTLSKSGKKAYIDSVKSIILQKPDVESNLIDVVEKYIIDEMALDLAFEGSRFADLLRIALHRAKESGNGYVDNEFIARHIAARDVFYEAQDSVTFYDNNEGKSTIISQTGFNTDLYNRLKVGTDLNPDMYMSLPE